MNNIRRTQRDIEQLEKSIKLFTSRVNEMGTVVKGTTTRLGTDFNT